MEELEKEITEPVPEDQQPGDPAPEESDPADEAEDTGTEEPPVTDPENPKEETGSVGSSEETGSGEETGTEDQTEESETADPAEGDETADLTEEAADQTDGTVSGNDVITISGNAVIFPEGFDLSQLNSSEGSTVDVTALIEAVEYQNSLIYSAALAISLLLGVVAGILLIHGFRLRRT